MSIDMDDIFGGISKAKARLDANYIKPGHYLCAIRRIKLAKNRKKKPFMATEMTVVKVLDDADGTANRRGEDISHVMLCEWDGFLSDAKAQFSALLQAPEDDIDVEACKLICGESQPCEHLIAEVYARNKVTNNDNDFTVVRYKRVLTEEEALEEVGAETLVEFNVVGESWGE